MRSIIMLPILLVAMFLQISIINQFEILSGFGNIVVLVLITWAIHTKGLSYIVLAMVAAIFFAFASAISPIIPIVSFLGATIIARRIANLTWQVPIITLVIATMVACLFENLTSIMYIWVTSNFAADLVVMINTILIPTIFLDLLLVIPVNFVIRDIAGWSEPITLEA